MATRPDSAQAWTYTEYARLPDDGNRYEVIAGELHMTPAPRPIHQRVVTRLTAVLVAFVAEHELGWVLAGPRARRPRPGLHRVPRRTPEPADPDLGSYR